MMRVNVWLDDERPIPAHLQAPLPAPQWVWVRTAPECIDLLRDSSNVIYDVSLDHDLGDECAHPRPGTGMDVIKWIEQRGWYPAGTIVVHSMNPVARANMRRALHRHEQRRNGDV